MPSIRLRSSSTTSIPVPLSFIRRLAVPRFVWAWQVSGGCVMMSRTFITTSSPGARRAGCMEMREGILQTGTAARAEAVLRNDEDPAVDGGDPGRAPCGALGFFLLHPRTDAAAQRDRSAVGVDVNAARVDVDMMVQGLDDPLLDVLGRQPRPDVYVVVDAAYPAQVLHRAFRGGLLIHPLDRTGQADVPVPHGDGNAERHVDAVLERLERVLRDVRIDPLFGQLHIQLVGDRLYAVHATGRPLRGQLGRISVDVAG